MRTQESYADKIAKLLRKAESTTPEEAEELYAKAQELMAKYAIDEAMVAAAGGSSKDDPIVKEEFVITGIYRFPLGRLSYYVLLNNGIKAILLNGSPWRKIGDRVYKETYVLVGVGYKSDIDRARALQTSLLLQAMRAENAWWQENKSLYEAEAKGVQHRARRGFLFAFAEGVLQKLSTATARGRKAAEAEHGSDSVALVLRDKSLMVQDEFDKHFPETVSRKSRINQGDAYARSHGYSAGQRADVGQPGVKGDSKKEINR